jgi:hypothetical protein
MTDTNIRVREHNSTAGLTSAVDLSRRFSELPFSTRPYVRVRRLDEPAAAPLFVAECDHGVDLGGAMGGEPGGDQGYE